MDESVRGHQPDGPKRWARARQAALANPHHKSSQVYFARVSAAQAVADAGTAQAWLHWRRRHGKTAYMYQTCSTYCAMLRLQLDLGLDGLEELGSVLENLDQAQEFITERPADSPRRGKCKVCAGPVPGV